MFEHTNSKHAPWYIVEANRKSVARLGAIKHLLSQIPYKEQVVLEVEMQD